MARCVLSRPFVTPYKVIAERESSDGLTTAIVARDMDGSYRFALGVKTVRVEHGLSREQALSMMPRDMRKVAALPQLSKRIDRTDSRKARKRGRK